MFSPNRCSIKLFRFSIGYNSKTSSNFDNRLWENIFYIKNLRLIKYKTNSVWKKGAVLNIYLLFCKFATQILPCVPYAKGTQNTQAPTGGTPLPLCAGRKLRYTRQQCVVISNSRVTRLWCHLTLGIWQWLFWLECLCSVADRSRQMGIGQSLHVI